MVKGNIELQKRRLVNGYHLKSINSQKGSALIGVAMAVVVRGLLVGGGLSLIAPRLKQQKYRKSLVLLKANMEYLVQYGLENKGKFGLYTSNCTPLLRYPLDVYRKPFLCFIAPELASNSTCARRNTSITVADQQDNATHNNVAIVLISGGENFDIQTKPYNPDESNEPVVIYPFGQTGVDDYCDDDVIVDDDDVDDYCVESSEFYDDQVAYLKLLELKEKYLCVHSEERLRILNNSLPTALNGTTYDATVYAAGGIPFDGSKYKWCVEGQGGLPSGLNLWCDATSILTLSSNCSSSNPVVAIWGKCRNIKILGQVNLGSNASRTYKFNFFVADDSKNRDHKNFILTVN